MPAASPSHPRPISTLLSRRHLATSLLSVGLVSGGAAAATAQTQTGTDGSATQLPPVSVEGTQGSGYQTTVPSLSKLPKPLLDTPESVSVVPKQLMEDQQTVTVRDALRNVPGISLGAGEGGSQGDNLTLRGFSARNDIFLDGMRDFGSYTRDPFDLEEIEVLKGPASVMFGRGSTGGVVNQVSKQPKLTPITAGTATLGTDGTKRLTFDINRSIEGLEGSAVRLNVMGNLNGQTGRDQAEYRRFGVAPSVAFGLGTPTRITIDYFHSQEYDTPDYGLPWLYGRPAATSFGSWYGFKDSDYLRTRVDIGTIKVEHDFNDSVTLRSQFRYGNYERDIRVTEPQVNYSGITLATPLSAITVTRNMIAVHSTETFLQNQTDATVRFSTGPFAHTLVGGFEIGKETSSPDRTAYTGVPSTNLLFPVEVPFTYTSSRSSTQARTTSNEAALWALDTVDLSEHWQIIGGIRWDNFDTTYDQQVSPTSHFQRTDSLLSGRAGLVYKPVPNGSFYFAWGTSFNPSAESLSLAASTADLAPEQNVSYEVGTKWDVLDGKLSLTGALFQITKNNARVPDPNNSAFNVLGGNQRVRGFEVGAAGHLTQAWEIYAGYAFLSSEVVQSTVASSVGEPLANVPKHTLSLWSTYQLPWYHVQVGGGMNYVSSRYGSSTATAQGAYNVAPGYVTFQAMTKVPIRPGLDLQVNATNLTNTKFYDLLHPAHVVPGSGRTILFTAVFAL